MEPKPKKIEKKKSGAKATKTRVVILVPAAENHMKLFAKFKGR